MLGIIIAFIAGSVVSVSEVWVFVRRKSEKCF